MSRIGKKPISIPDKTKVTFKDGVVTVQGKNGSLTQAVHTKVDLKIENNVINVVAADQSRTTYKHNIKR